MSIKSMDIKTSDFYENDNMNLFDIQHEFFVIDSEHLNDVETRMYGFSIQNSGIFEEMNMTQEAAEGLNGCGVYVYVENIHNEKEKIKIRQDYNGSYGLYFYESDNYFAISNSFFVLLDHLKSRFPLTLDRDYANHILLDTLCSSAYSETSVNEIRLLPRDIIIEIDIETKNYNFTYVDYKDNSIAIDTFDGIAILDNWFKKWTTIFKNLKSHTDQIVVNLSGGFDSRITFMLMLKSGINLNEIQIRTINDGLHTHDEDYQIASEIAEHYEFALNNKKLSVKAIHYSLEDIINIAFYTKMTFHKELYFKHHKFAEKHYVIPGDGGESIRTFWNISLAELEKQNKNKAQRYTAAIAKEMAESFNKILESAYPHISKKYKIDDESSKKYPWCLHRETRDRSHFGKAAVENLFSNTYMLTPLIDPDIRKINFDDFGNQNKDFLIALIYIRYCPSLLDFPFEGNRTIDENTIKMAKDLNARFPVKEDVFSADIDNDFNIVIEDEDVISKINAGIDNKVVPNEVPDKYLREAFESCGCHKLFTAYFDEEIYDYAGSNIEKSKYHPLRECYIVLGLTRVIESIMEGECIQKPAMIDTMDRLIKTNYYKQYKYSDLLKKSKNYITARIDVLFKDRLSDGELIWISDEKAKVTNPNWFQKNGKGYVIESYLGILDMTFKACSDGELDIWLRGLDVHDEEGNRIPYWIDYTNFQCNQELQFDDIKPVYHDKPFFNKIKIKSNDIVKLHIEWQPHQYEIVTKGDDETYIQRNKRTDNKISAEASINPEDISIMEFIKIKAKGKKKNKKDLHNY